MYEAGPTIASIIFIITAILIIIGIFLLLRKLVLWYFNIDRMVKNQETTNKLLREILDTFEKGQKRE
jgi:hypothetical protein